MKHIEALRDATTPPLRPPPERPAPVERRPAELLWTLIHARWLVLAVALGFVGLGGVYVLVATPIYHSDTVVQIEESTRTIPGLGELSALLSDKEPADTEMEILRSRSLLGSVIEKLGLDIVARPRTFPGLAFVARRYTGSTPAPARFGLASYAWGGEHIRVQRLDVAERVLNVPLTLVAMPGGAYVVRDPAGETVLRGAVGMPAAGGAPDARVEMFVSELVARPGTEFRIVRRSLTRVISEMQDQLRINERGRKTGILTVALEGPDPVRAAAILDAVATTYVRQNVERRSAEAAKKLEFLESQLPKLKGNLDSAEAALKGMQVQKGTVDLSHEAESLLDRSVKVESALSEAELQRSDLLQRFTENHPSLQTLNDKIAKLRTQQNAINSKMRELPGTELDTTRLTRDVKLSSELYNTLLNKAQELRVVKSGTIGSVRVLDAAMVPEEPVSPRAPIVLSLALLVGLTGGVALAFARKSLYDGIDDPEQVERVTGMSVYATVPRSPAQASVAREAARAAGTPALLAAVAPNDSAVEAMRSLRTALQFALLDASNNVIVITGPTAEVGKSFVTLNLAYVLASAGKRVLVVDGDLRRGHLHRSFGAHRAPGLSDVLAGTQSVSEAIRKTSVDNLHWISTGRVPPNPAELLGSERFERVLSELSARYDIVLVDTAPVLPVTDAALVARHAGTTLLVLRAGAHPAREVSAAMKRFAQNGVSVNGAVFNDITGVGARYMKYGYEYRSDTRS